MSDLDLGGPSAAPPKPSADVADLLIIGGGPAGLSLAILAKSYGLSVGVMEASTLPRVSHGDTLPAGIDGYFELMGISRERLYRDAEPFSSHCLRWGELPDVVSAVGHTGGSIPTHGLHVPRHFLEPMLLERAQELKIEVLQSCVVKQALTRDNKICGVQTNRGRFLSKFVVDAGGSRHWLARKLGMPVEFHSPKLYGYYNWARGHCPECYDHPLVYTDDLGWTWISRVEKDLYQVTRQTFEAVKDFRDWLPPEFVKAGLVPIGPTRGADLTWRFVARPAGRGFFMIGDAVRRSDPVTQRGIERAMIDACKVSQLLSRWKDGVMDEDLIAKEYVEEVRADYAKGLKNSYGLLSHHPHAPDWLKASEPFYERHFL